MNEPIKIFTDGQPCEHESCEKHISHPCEWCGRIGAKGTAEMHIVFESLANIDKKDNDVTIRPGRH